MLISTKHKCLGTQLHIVSASTPIEEMPDPLCSSNITMIDYEQMMGELRYRLSKWKGGWATLGILALAVGVVVAFVVAVFIPGFWASPLFHHPLYLGAVAAAQIFVFVVLVGFMRRESTRLIQDVRDLFRPWRGRGVFVDLKRVSRPGGTYTLTHRASGHTERYSSSSGGTTCFCLIMDVMGDDEAARRDASSVATVDTSASLDSLDDQQVVNLERHY